MKRVVWLGSSYNRLIAFPAEARSRAGYQLNQVQQGGMPDDWKPMATTIGSGVIEIRIHVPHEHRVIYTATIGDAVYVLHAFEKKTQKTPDKDLNIARAAYAELKKNAAKKR
jgi:phage-related protein